MDIPNMSNESSAETLAPLQPLSARVFAVARALCACICLTVIALDVISIPSAFAYFQTACSPCGSNDINLSPVQAHAMVAAGISIPAFAAYKVTVIVVTEFTFFLIGALLYLRKSHDGMALLTSLTLVLFGGVAFTGTLHALTPTHPALGWLDTLLSAMGQISFFIFLYVFPTGRFVPRWTIVPAAIWSIAWLLPIFGNTQIDEFVSTRIQDGPVFLALLLSLVVAQVYRYRKVSTPVQKRQTKWVVLGLGIGLSTFIALMVIGNFLKVTDLGVNPVGALITTTIAYCALLLIPITIAVAVLRSQLFDIDILIKRTVVYGLLTTILAGLYFALVVGTQTLTRDITGQQVGQQPIAIVLSTLLIAALITPLRRLLQNWIDQRFYRGKYNAARTIEAFSASLRSEVDLSQLRAHLVDVVHETMMPEHVSLWIAQKSPASNNTQSRMS